MTRDPMARDNEAQEQADGDRGQRDGKTLAFSYRLRGAGWAQAEILTPGERILLSVSYLSDALGDMVRRVASICEGGRTQAHWTWEDEPGEHIWLVERISQGRCVVTVLSDRFRRGHQRDAHEPEGFERVVNEVIPFRQFVEEVAHAAQGVLDLHGEQGYIAAWGNDETCFPTEALIEIQAWLKATQGTGRPKSDA